MQPHVKSVSLLLVEGQDSDMPACAGPQCLWDNQREWSAWAWQGASVPALQ